MAKNSPNKSPHKPTQAPGARKAGAASVQQEAPARKSSSPLRWVLNRYVLTLLIALLWMLFFDKYNYFLQKRLSDRIEALEEDKVFYQQELERLKARKQALDTDALAIERLAREQYLMKKPEEDLYILVPEEKN